MVIFIIPPSTPADLAKDLQLLRSACAGASDPELTGLLGAMTSRTLGEDATVDEVQDAWRAVMKQADAAIVSMKKSLAAHIRAGTEPAAAREELKALAAAIATIRRQRELQPTR